MTGIANECIPYYEPGARLTVSAGTALVGKRFVDISATIEAGPALNTGVGGGNIVCAPATAKGLAIGVAAYDAAITTEGSVICAPGTVLPVIADGPITAGDEVEVGTAGKAKTKSSTGQAVGRALKTVTDGQEAMIILYGSGGGGGGQPPTGDEYAQGTAAAAPTAITDSTGGTADGTFSPVGATNSGDVSGVINNNFKETAVYLIAIRTALVEFGIWT